MKMLLDIAGTELTGKRLVPQKLTDEERKQFVGGYYSDELEVMYRLEDHHSKLWLRHRKGEFALRPTDKDQMVGDFGDYGGMVTLRFVRNDQKAITGFTLASGRVKGLKFARAEIKTVQ